MNCKEGAAVSGRNPIAGNESGLVIRPEPTGVQPGTLSTVQSPFGFVCLDLFPQQCITSPAISILPMFRKSW